MEYFAKIVNDMKPLTIFVKCSFLDVQQDFEYAFGLIDSTQDMFFPIPWRYVQLLSVKSAMKTV